MSGALEHEPKFCQVVSWVHIQIESPPFNRFTSNSLRSLQNPTSHLWWVYCRHHQQSLRNVLNLNIQPTRGLHLAPWQEVLYSFVVWVYTQSLWTGSLQTTWGPHKALSPPERVHFQQINRLFEDIWMFDQPNRGLYINICWFGIQPTRGLHLAPRQEVTAVKLLVIVVISNSRLLIDYGSTQLF